MMEGTKIQENASYLHPIRPRNHPQNLGARMHPFGSIKAKILALRMLMLQNGEISI